MYSTKAPEIHRVQKSLTMDGDAVMTVTVKSMFHYIHGDSAEVQSALAIYCFSLGRLLF